MAYDEYEVHPDEIGYLKARDFYDEPLSTRPWERSSEASDFDARVREIMDSAQHEGIREPVDVQFGRMHDGAHRWEAARRLNIPLTIRRHGSVEPLEVQDYDGVEGNNDHITRNEYGMIPVDWVRNMRGARGEVPGEHRNYEGDEWEEFKNHVDSGTPGYVSPIFITVEHGKEPEISEGNHRRDAHVEKGKTHIPAEIRYFGHAERQGTVGERAMRRTASEEPILTWDEIGERHPAIYGDPEYHGEEAEGADGEGIGWAAAHLAFNRPGHDEPDEGSWDLDFKLQNVPVSQIDFARHGAGDSRVESARRWYRSGVENVVPPVLVHRHGVYNVADGHHRGEAAHLERKSAIPAYVAQSPHEDEPFSDGARAPYHGAEPQQYTAAWDRERNEYVYEIEHPDYPHVDQPPDSFYGISGKYPFINLKDAEPNYHPANLDENDTVEPFEEKWSDDVYREGEGSRDMRDDLRSDGMHFVGSANPDESGLKAAGIAVIAMDTGRVLMLQRALNPLHCPCGQGVTWDEQNGYQHDDGSVSHDEDEFYGQTVSDLLDQGHPDPKKCACCLGTGDDERGSECVACDGAGGVYEDSGMCDPPCRESIGKKASSGNDIDYYSTPRRVRLSGSKHVYVTGQRDIRGERVYISPEGVIPQHQNRSGWHHISWLEDADGVEKEAAYNSDNVPSIALNWHELGHDERREAWLKWQEDNPHLRISEKRMWGSPEGVVNFTAWPNRPGSRRDREWPEESNEFITGEDDKTGVFQPMVGMDRSSLADGEGEWGTKDEWEMKYPTEGEYPFGKHGSWTRAIEHNDDSAMGLDPENDWVDATAFGKSFLYRRGRNDGEHHFVMPPDQHTHLWTYFNTKGHGRKGFQQAEHAMDYGNFLVDDDDYEIGQGRVLPPHTAALEHDPNEGTWEFPGGKIDPGESARDAAVREFREEVGQDLPPGVFVGAWVSPGGIRTTAATTRVAAVGDWRNVNFDDRQRIQEEMDVLHPTRTHQTPNSYPVNYVTWTDSEHPITDEDIKNGLDQPMVGFRGSDAAPHEMGASSSLWVSKEDDPACATCWDRKNQILHESDHEGQPHKFNPLTPEVGERRYAAAGDQPWEEIPNYKGDLPKGMQDWNWEEFSNNVWLDHGYDHKKVTLEEARRLSRLESDERNRPIDNGKSYTHEIFWNPDKNGLYRVRKLDKAEEKARQDAHFEREARRGYWTDDNIYHEYYDHANKPCFNCGEIHDRPLEPKTSAKAPVYKGFIYLIQSEKEIDLSLREIANPDDPDGDMSEQCAWWDIEHAKDNPALREEVKQTPWGELELWADKSVRTNKEIKEAFAKLSMPTNYDYLGGLRYELHESDPITPGCHKIVAIGPDGEPHGSIRWHKDNQREYAGEINNVWVHPSQRRNGLATELLSRAKQVSQEKGWAPVIHSPDLLDDGEEWVAGIGDRAGGPAFEHDSATKTAESEYAWMFDNEQTGGDDFDEEDEEGPVNYEQDELFPVRQPHHYYHAVSGRPGSEDAQAHFDSQKASVEAEVARLKQMHQVNPDAAPNAMIRDKQLRLLGPEWNYVKGKGGFAKSAYKNVDGASHHVTVVDPIWRGGANNHEAVYHHQMMYPTGETARKYIHDIDRVFNAVEGQHRNPDDSAEWPVNSPGWTRGPRTREPFKTNDDHLGRTRRANRYDELMENAEFDPEKHKSFPDAEDGRSRGGKGPQWTVLRDSFADNPYKTVGPSSFKAGSISGQAKWNDADKAVTDFTWSHYALPIAHAVKDPKTGHRSITVASEGRDWGGTGGWGPATSRVTREVYDGLKRGGYHVKWDDDVLPNKDDEKALGKAGFERSGGDFIRTSEGRRGNLMHHRIIPLGGQAGGLYQVQTYVNGLPKTVRTGPKAITNVQDAIKETTRRHRKYGSTEWFVYEAAKKCTYCKEPSTKEIVHSEGMAYIPVCGKHLDKGKKDAAACVPYGEPDPSNINTIREASVDRRPQLPEGLVYRDPVEWPWMTSNDDEETTDFWRYRDPDLVPSWNDNDRQGQDVGSNESHGRTVDVQPMMMIKPQSEFGGDSGRNFDRAQHSREWTNVHWGDPICEHCYLRHGLTVPNISHEWAVEGQKRKDPSDLGHEFKPMTPDVDEKGRLKQAATSKEPKDVQNHNPEDVLKGLKREPVRQRDPEVSEPWWMYEESVKKEAAPLTEHEPVVRRVIRRGDDSDSNDEGARVHDVSLPSGDWIAKSPQYQHLHDPEYMKDPEDVEYFKRRADEDATMEEFSSRLGQALSDTGEESITPEVQRSAKPNDPPGTHYVRKYPDFEDLSEHEDRDSHVNTPRGKVIGYFHAVMGEGDHVDHHNMGLTSSLRNFEDKIPVSIDHTKSSLGLYAESLRDGDPERIKWAKWHHEYGISPYAQHFLGIDAAGFGARKRSNPLAPGDTERAQAAAETLRPWAKERGVEHWLDAAQHRMTMLGKYASGAESMFPYRMGHELSSGPVLHYAINQAEKHWWSIA